MEELSRRERKKRETRARIMKMAKQIFEQKGYDNTSIDDISEAVDISKPTLFNYFASKESILLGISDEELEQIKDFLSVNIAKESSSIRKIILLMERMYYDSIKYTHLNSKILFSTFPENGQEESKMSRDYKEIFSQLVEEAISRQELSNNFSVEEIVHAIMVCAYGLIIDCYSTGKKDEVRQKFDSAVKILLKGIGISN